MKDDCVSGNLSLRIQAGHTIAKDSVLSSPAQLVADDVKSFRVNPGRHIASVRYQNTHSYSTIQTRPYGEDAAREGGNMEMRSLGFFNAVQIAFLCRPAIVFHRASRKICSHPHSKFLAYPELSCNLRQDTQRLASRR